VYNVLYARVVMDMQFLDAVMGTEAGVGKAYKFTGTLWRGWKNIREHGMVQVGLRLLSYFAWVGVDGA
jgi:glutathione synthase